MRAGLAAGLVPAGQAERAQVEILVAAAARAEGDQARLLLAVLAPAFAGFAQADGAAQFALVRAEVCVVGDGVTVAAPAFGAVIT